jgi:hypothetical protein
MRFRPLSLASDSIFGIRAHSISPRGNRLNMRLAAAHEASAVRWTAVRQLGLIWMAIGLS